MTDTKFGGLGISPEVMSAVTEMGYIEPTAIQAAAIPILLAGRDLIGQSQTGSGKTAAFGIPVIQRVDAAKRVAQALILCPTRELAAQVAGEIVRLGARVPALRVATLSGGVSYGRQFAELKEGAQIVVGTPGRVMDHLERGTLSLKSLKVAVLDEADRMLDMGFRDDIEHILSGTPAHRQTAFFSATVSKPIRDLIQRHSTNPESIRGRSGETTAPPIEQWFYQIPHRGREEALLRLIRYHGFKLGIIFCNTQRGVDELADALAARGLSVDRIHGGMAQAQRTRTMRKFKDTGFAFLVATDVAGRGIDVDGLEVVVNYDLPGETEDYVHRIGRTARAGRHGIAIAFASGRDTYKIRAIEKFTHTRMTEGHLPTVAEIKERQSQALIERVRETLATEAWRAASEPVGSLIESGFPAHDVASALFHLLSHTPPEAPHPAAHHSLETDDVSHTTIRKKPMRPSKHSLETSRDEVPPKRSKHAKHPKRKGFQKPFQKKFADTRHPLHHKKTARARQPKWK